MSKTMSKTSLGKGLGALIPAGSPGMLLKGTGGGATEVELHRIIASEYQPRKNFKDDAIASLAESIKSVGVIQPVILRRRDEGGYQLIAGERRFRAAALAGLTRIPAIVKDVSPAEVLEMALVENIQREDLNPIETAEAYERLVGEFKLTQEELSAKVGKDRSTVANFLRLLTLPPEVKRDLAEGALTMGHAKAILSLDAASKQMALRREIISRGLSVREAEGAAKRLKAPGHVVKKKGANSPPSAQMEMLEDELKKKLGTKVKIKRKGKRGSINIEFYSDAELDRLLEFLRG
ncbi:MAG: ParB/RepB/Spo0J family partition protein [Nitrospirota bacterium]